MNAGADIHLFGQEVNPETFAICKADLYLVLLLEFQATVDPAMALRMLERAGMDP